MIRVALFQSLRVTADQVGPVDLGSPTTRSLFAYLLLNRTQPVDRRHLAFLFWPRGTETAARRNLRQYLHRTRRGLEGIPSVDPLILAEGSYVQFNPELPVWVDVEAFVQGIRPEAGLGEQQAAVALYTGAFLADLYDDWCAQEREHLHELYRTALQRISQALLEANNPQGTIAYAQAWVAADPLDENAQRTLMSAYARAGDQHRALRQYRTLVDLLQSELNARPSSETEALYHSIQSPEYPIGQPAPAHAAPAIRPIQVASLPLVGRRQELEVLRAAADRAAAGAGTFLLIAGESGIGKTRLVQEYLSRTPDRPAVQVTCNEFEVDVPYASLRRALATAYDGPAGGIDRTSPPGLVGAPMMWSYLPTHPQPRLPQEADPVGRPSILDDLRDMIFQLSQHGRSQPFHLVLDDLHWGDGQTWRFLAYLAQYAKTWPIVMIGISRLEDLTAGREKLVRNLERQGLLEIVTLHRLTLAESSALAGHMLSSDLMDQLFLRRLYLETEGNPFFIIETARAILETGQPLRRSAERGPGAGALTIPLSIQRVIEARLDRLSEPGRELLAAAATIGRSFAFATLEGVSQAPPEAIVSSIEEWMGRGLIREGVHQYHFSHEKIRQVAYVGLSRARRQFLHRRVADVIAASFPPADSPTLAYHYSQSDQPHRALPYLTGAGEEALRVRSYDEARQFGLRAISLLGRMPGPFRRGERVDLNLQLAQAYAFTGDLARAHEILNQTEEMAVALEDPSRLGSVFHRSSQIYWLRGKPDAAGDYARRTLRLGEELDDPRLIKAALRMLGRVGIALSTFDDAIANLSRYIDLEAGASRTPELAIVHGYLGVACARVGSWRRADQAGETALEMAISEGLQQTKEFASLQLAFIHAEARRWNKAAQVLEAIPVVEEELDENFNPRKFMHLGLLGLIHTQMGHPERGVASIRKGLAWADQTDYRVFHYLPRLFLAEALKATGEFEAAMRQADQAREEAGQAGDRWAKAIALRVLADVLTADPHPDWSRVEQLLIASMHLLRQVRARPDLARTYLALRRLYDRAGQIAWAVDCHFRATLIFDELGMVDELRIAQGQAAGDRRGAIVIPNLGLLGPNQPLPAESA